MIWIIENAHWIVTAIFTAIATLWTYFTTKKNKDLETKLIEADAKLKELEVDAGHMDLNDKANQAVERAVDRILKIKATEITVLEESYEHQIATIKGNLIEAQTLKEEAGHLADSYKKLIERLREYNNYLKALLDLNKISYKDEDEL